MAQSRIEMARWSERVRAESRRLCNHAVALHQTSMDVRATMASRASYWAAVAGAAPDRPVVMVDGFGVAVSRIHGATLVRVYGDLDMATAPRLARALRAHVDGPVVVDCEHLTFLDASGLRILAAAARAGCALTLRNVSAKCAMVLAISGVDKVVPSDDAEHRLASVGT